MLSIGMRKAWVMFVFVLVVLVALVLVLVFSVDAYVGGWWCWW